MTAKERGQLGWAAFVAKHFGGDEQMAKDYVGAMGRANYFLTYQGRITPLETFVSNWKPIVPQLVTKTAAYAALAEAQGVV